MHLNHLSLVNFKNCTESSFDFSNRVNCFLGNNGEGKTNLLDAIYYLSNCKSYFNSIDSQNVKFNEPFFVLQGRFELEDQKLEEIYCGVKIGHKKIVKKNKKQYKRLAEHVGLLPVVLITPYDSNLILDGSDIRRKFMDIIISQFDRNIWNINHISAFAFLELVLLYPALIFKLFLKLFFSKKKL